MMHGVQLHLTGCSALHTGRRPRAAVTTFVTGTITNLLTGANARCPWTPSSLIHTHKHQHLMPLCLRSLRLRPSNLQMPTISVLAPLAPGPWALVLSWSSTAVTLWHDLTMHRKPHYHRFLPSDHEHLCSRVGLVQQRGSQRQYWMSVARRQYPGQSCDLHPTSATKLSSILNYDHWGGTSPLHRPYMSECTLIGAPQYQPFSSFTSPSSTPIFDKTSPASTHAQLIHL